MQGPLSNCVGANLHTGNPRQGACQCLAMTNPPAAARRGRGAAPGRQSAGGAAARPRPPAERGTTLRDREGLLSRPRGSVPLPAPLFPRRAWPCERPHVRTPSTLAAGMGQLLRLATHQRPFHRRCPPPPCGPRAWPPGACHQFGLGRTYMACHGVGHGHGMAWCGAWHRCLIQRLAWHCVPEQQPA